MIRVACARRRSTAAALGLHAATPLVAQERAGGAPVDDQVQRLLRARVEHDLGRLVALADDLQRRLVAGPPTSVTLALHASDTRNPLSPSRHVRA